MRFRSTLLPLTLALALSVTFAGCGTPAAVAGRSTANLTAPGIQALHKKEVVRALDTIRDTAVDGEAMGVIPTTTTRLVVTWHRSTLATIDASAAGWQSAVTTGLDQLKLDIPAADRGKIAPYIDAAITLFKAVIQ